MIELRTQGQPVLDVLAVVDTTPVSATFRLSGLAQGAYELLHDGDAVVMRFEQDESPDSLPQWRSG